MLGALDKQKAKAERLIMGFGVDTRMRVRPTYEPQKLSDKEAFVLHALEGRGCRVECKRGENYWHGDAKHSGGCTIVLFEKDRLKLLQAL